MLIYTFCCMISIVCARPHKCGLSVPANSDQVPNVPQPSGGESSSRYWSGSSCAADGTYSVNEFGANICEYPGDTCPVVKYFSYPDGGGGVELCCNSNSDCNYDPIKNYCHPDLKRCTNGQFFGCSEKGGPLFDECK